MAHCTAVAQRRNTKEPTKGVWTDQITGRYRKITVHQLAMAWWCHQAGHITRRQLRVWFAVHEMAERRRYTDPGTCRDAPRQPLYSLDELKALVGGRGSPTADAELSADLRTLNRLGLVKCGHHAIEFAVSIDRLAVDDVSGFWSMFNQLPHHRRAVPVPRRMVRALAAGFTKGVTAVVIAALIRSLFWHKEKAAYRVDGRTKREWIAEVFGVSVRTVTDARARLIELGWLVPLETPQFLLNRYGTHDAINTEWERGEGGRKEESGGVPGGAGDAFKSESCGGSSGGVGDRNRQAGSASPRSDFQAGSASPDLNRSLPLTGNQTTRTPAPTRAEPAGVSRCSTRRKGGRKENIRRPGAAPTIRDIRSEDLADVGRLLELHTQAVKLGIARAGEGGRLEFLAMAERARARGNKAGALFFWLLKERKSMFITQSDEDEANRRLKEHLYGPARERTRERWGGGRGTGQGGNNPQDQNDEFSAEERFVIACIRVAQQHRIEDPFVIARRGKGWTREQWDEAYLSHQTSQQQRWRGMGEERD